MTKIRDIKSEIQDLDITIDEAIMIWVPKFFEFFFAQFLGILSHKVRENDKLPILKNLAKFLKDDKL